MMKIIRKILGTIILFFDALIKPRPMDRSESDQAKVVEEAKSLALYQFHACPFCVKVRRAARRLNVPIAICDAQGDEKHRADLLAGGGRVKVPCLRIQDKEEVRWMYESSHIISYLEDRFGAALNQ